MGSHKSNHRDLRHGSSAGSDEPQSLLSRRSFLGGVSTSGCLAAAGSAVPGLVRPEEAHAESGEDDSSRRERSYKIRVDAAKAERSIPLPRQINNGDERRYDNFIGNYTQGLPHNGIGEVDPNAYQLLLTAVRSGSPRDFANIPLGGNVKLANPQGGLAFDLE